MTKTPRVLVLRTAGTNCDLETVHAFDRAGASVERVHIRRLFAEPRALDRAHVLVLPGGFTYGDDLGAGRILAGEIRHRLGDAIRRFVGQGKLILGICNGFQALVKSGILPGGDGTGPQSVTLTFNASGRFEDRWVHVEAVSGRSAFVEKGRRLYLPVAHAEGRFLARDEGVLEGLRRDDQVLFRYVAPGGGGGAAGTPATRTARWTGSPGSSTPGAASWG